MFSFLRGFISSNPQTQHIPESNAEPTGSRINKPQTELLGLKHKLSSSSSDNEQVDVRDPGLNLKAPIFHNGHKYNFSSYSKTTALHSYRCVNYRKPFFCKANLKFNNVSNEITENGVYNYII